jgi:hypothetical protein
MKKKVFFIVLVVGIFCLSSCSSYLAGKIASSMNDSQERKLQSSLEKKWEVCKFAEVSGKKANHYYIAFQRQIKGGYTDIAFFGGSVSINIAYSDVEGMAFTFYENYIIGDEKIDALLIIEENGKKIEKEFQGTADAKGVYIPQNEELFNILSTEQEIRFKITVTKNNAAKNKIHYEFVFIPEDFTESYAKMNALESEVKS